MAACWGRKNYMHACWSQLVIGKNMPASWSQFNVLEKYARLLEPIEWGKNNMPACWSQLIVGENNMPACLSHLVVGKNNMPACLSQLVVGEK